MKAELRRKLQALRRELTGEEIERLSRRIWENLESLEEFRRAGTVMFYASAGNEVRTAEMIRQTLALRKRVLVPVLEPGSDLLRAGEIFDPERDLSSRVLGCPTPDFAACPPASPAEIDLVVIPGVGFDAAGNRLGRGRGCYDVFLKQAPSAFRVGVAFEFQVRAEIPSAPHDCRMDLVVTEDRVIRCPRNRLKAED